MSLYKKLYDAFTSCSTLVGLVGNSIYPIMRVQEAPTPAIVYRRMMGIRDYHLSGYSTLENPLVGIEIYTSSVDSRLSVFDAVIDALEDTTTVSHVLTASPTDNYDDETKVYSRSLEVSVWNRE